MIKHQTILLSLILCSLALSGTSVAASLIVDAVVLPWTGETAYIGHTNYSIALLISVQNLEGTPITDLDATNFRVSTLIAPKEFYRENITMIRIDKAYIGLGRSDQNIYEIIVAPAGSATWGEGGYVFLAEVVQGENKGQKMLSLTIADLSSREKGKLVASSPAPSSPAPTN